MIRCNSPFAYGGGCVAEMDSQQSLGGTICCSTAEDLDFNVACILERCKYAERMEDMYTAKEAREKAERSSSDATKEQLLAVERCIGFSVNRGKTSCCYDAALREQAIERLQGLGYTVEDRSNQRDGMSYLISW